MELSFRNNSLVVSGDIRMVQSVRAVLVDVPRSWHDLRTGWYTVNDFPICSSNAAHFIDVTTDYLVVDWPFRTTVAYHDIRGWEVIELCERIFPMAEESSSYCGRWLSTTFDSPFKDRALHFRVWNGSCRTCPQVVALQVQL